ncbi:hypothetical protein QE152_g27509 [Popillia japonica]|uniref:Uncharacterized protein n=1 Tax=Popillia japonica TaxID=7064 RepID=A0AAW1JVA0_POPJA
MDVQLHPNGLRSDCLEPMYLQPLMAVQGFIALKSAPLYPLFTPVALKSVTNRPVLSPPLAYKLVETLLLLTVIKFDLIDYTEVMNFGR